MDYPHVPEPKQHETIDELIGMRIRQRRKDYGISMKMLADVLGITYQQVQKYEHGKNRVSASRLWQIAYHLQVPMGYFFEGER